MLIRAGFPSRARRTSTGTQRGSDWEDWTLLHQWEGQRASFGAWAWTKSEEWDQWWDLRNMAGWSLCWGTQGSRGGLQRPQALCPSLPGQAMCPFLFANFVFKVQLPRATVAPALLGRPRLSLLQSIYMFSFPTALTPGSSRALATPSPASPPLDGQALLSYPKM